MKTTIRLIVTIAALTVLLAIANVPQMVKNGLNLADNWQLFAIQIFGLATLRVFWSWPLCDKILDYIIDALRGRGSQVRDIVPRPAPPTREVPEHSHHLDGIVFPSNPHMVNKTQVGLGNVDQFYGFLTPRKLGDIVRELDKQTEVVQKLHDQADNETEMRYTGALR